MAVRVATERDLPRVLEIERASFPNPWPEPLLRGHLGEGGFLVYEDDETGEVVGYILVGLRIPSFFERLERRTRALVGLPVDPDGRGVGEALLREGLEHLKALGAETAELEVRADNRAAIKLYEKHGFRVKERLPGYYGPGQDGLLMVKPLKPLEPPTPESKPEPGVLP